MRASWLVLATAVLVTLASALAADADAAGMRLAFVVEPTPTPAPTPATKPIEPVAPKPAPATPTVDVTRRDGPFPPPGRIPVPPVPEVATVLPPQIITILAVGDAGFNSSLQRVEADGVRKHGFLTWEEATSGIAAEITGDVNIMNVETVVTDRNDLDHASKGESTSYYFRSHPNGIRQFVRIGFNVAGLANNHAMDFGEAGLRETLANMQRLKVDGLLAYSGLGLDHEEATRPQAFQVKGVPLAFAATGIVTLGNTAFQAGPGKPGQSAYQYDFNEVVDRLAKADARYRILAIHHGANGEVATDDKQILEWREQAVIGRGIDLVIGHHPHVIRAAERIGDKVILYGLGNFLHQGMSDMGNKGLCRDFGLVFRIHLLAMPGEKPRLRAIEAIPVTDMQARTKRLSPEESTKRIHALNYLGERLPKRPATALPADATPEGLRFTPTADGTGLYCLPGAASDPGRIGALCKDYRLAPAIPDTMIRRVAGACGGGYGQEARSGERGSTKSRKHRREKSQLRASSRSSSRR